MGTKRERILQKLNPMLLKITPKLSGDEGSFIDLDSEDSLEDGAKKLMMRFFRNKDLCEKNKRKSVENDTEVMISSAKYNENEEICGLTTEKLSVPFVVNEESEVSERPGQRLQKLKVELQEKMTAKWEEEYKKRINESKSFDVKHKKEKKCGMSENEEENGSDNDDESHDVEDCNDDDEGEEGDDDGDEADDESEENENDSEASCSINKGQENGAKSCDKHREKTPEKKDAVDDDEICSLVPAYQPGGGLLYGGSELTQNDEELPQDLMSPSLKFSMSESPGCKMQSQSFSDATPKKDSILIEDKSNSFMENNKLFSQNQNNSYDLNDAFEFCSGKFPENPESENLLVGQINFNDCDGNDDDDDDDDECEEDEEENDDDDDDDESSKETEPEKNLPKMRKNILAFEDSEEDEEEKGEEKQIENESEEANSSARKLLSDDEEETVIENENDGTGRKRKKKKKSLHFSDEEDEREDDSEDVASREKEEEEEEEEEGEEEDGRSVHYDSEENEIINPKEFFEKEAELSGSEWSGDEDERGLDEFDIEEGDADHLDDTKVRSQLEKIHIRRVLDDDAREVRLIQEILFEDGDLHSDGKKRDRKFKWKNLGTFEEDGKGEKGKEEGGNESEEEGGEEEQERKLRYEKELFLMTKKKNGEESSEEEMSSEIQMIKVRRVKTTENSDSGKNKIKNIFEFSESNKNFLTSNCRGSFLTRNEEFLSRLAKATAAVSDSILGARNSRNFVFAIKSPEKNDPERESASDEKRPRDGMRQCDRKRQMEEAGSCGREEKRTKILPREVDTGPSILDLLV